MGIYSISDYINQNLRLKTPKTYGEILNGERGIGERDLTTEEKEQLELLKKQDKMRLIRENTHEEQSMLRREQFINMSGMSGITQQIL